MGRVRLQKAANVTDAGMYSTPANFNVPGRIVITRPRAGLQYMPSSYTMEEEWKTNPEVIQNSH